MKIMKKVLLCLTFSLLMVGMMPLSSTQVEAAEKKIESDVGITFDNDFTPKKQVTGGNNGNNNGTNGYGRLPLTGGSSSLPKTGSTSSYITMVLGLFFLMISTYVLRERIYKNKKNRGEG